jgi:hypothetical protein
MEAHEHLNRLAQELRQAGFTVTAHDGPARLTVQNPAAHALTEDMLCAADDHGQLTFWWTWETAISPAEDIASAVERISHVLKEVGA